MRDFKDLKIAVAGTGARDIIGSTKKKNEGEFKPTVDCLCATRRGLVCCFIK